MIIIEPDNARLVCRIVLFTQTTHVQQYANIYARTRIISKRDSAERAFATTCSLRGRIISK
jgi:hypothetical protein